MADDERSDSVQSVEIPSDMLQLLSNGGVPPAEITMSGNDLTTIDGIPGFQPETLNDLSTPRLNILEQPKSRGFRFRYGCEGPSHGGLPGVNSQKGSRKRTYPSIEIQNYKGTARIVVSLVTNEEIPKPHAHSLVGKNCTNGICTVQLGPSDMTASFPNLGILHVTRKDVKKVLKERMLEHRKIYQSVMGSTGANETEKELDKHADEAAKNMDLSVVRLCFQAYLPDSNGNFTRTLTPVISVPVYDCKAPNAATLKICRMDKSAGCATGGDEVYLLCDKVQKEDIQIRFFEMSSEGNLTWEAYADFGPTDVHRQFAIVFKTPAYHNINIDKQKYVQVQLKRRTDGDVSDPKPFTYYPREHDREFIQRKRKKPLPHFSDHFGGRTGFGNAGGGAGSRTFGSSSSSSPYQFSSTSVPGAFNFQQASSNFQSSMQQGVQPQVVQQNTISQQMQQQIQLQQQQQQQLRQQMQQQQQQQQQPQQQQPQQQPQQQQLSNLYQPRPGVVLQPRGIGGLSPSVTEASDGDRVVPQKPRFTVTKVKEENVGELQVDSAPMTSDDEGDLETDSTPVVTVESGSLEVDSAPIDSDSEEYKSRKGPWVKFVGQETVTNIETEEFDKGITDIELQDSGIQTDAIDLEYDSLAWRLAERTSNAMRDYAITADIKMLLAVQRHLTAVEDDQGDTPLHLAIIHKKYEVAFALLSVIISIPKQKIVNHYNKLKQTPLHLAVLTDQPRMVDLLLRCGADPNLLDGDGNMPIHIAAKEKVKDVTQVLCHGPTAKAACKVIKTDIDARNLDGFTAAQLSIKKKDLRNLKVLVKNGANVNVADGKSGRTCLHHAVERPDFSILGYLITDAEADVHAVNFSGDTPLHIASSLDYIGVASLLLAAGADIYCQNYDFSGELGSDEEGDESGEKMEEMVKKKELTLEREQRSEEDDELSGKTPLDLAKSERMKMVLMGTPYRPVEDDAAEPVKGKRNPEFLESGYKSHTPEQSAEGNAVAHKSIEYSLNGDLYRVDKVARQKLGGLLDSYTSPNHDWRGVAEKVGLGNMVNNLRLLESPTMVLLKHYEEMDGTIEELMDVLIEMKRQDAVHVLKQCSEIKPGGKHEMRWDSAFGTLEESMQDMSLANAS